MRYFRPLILAFALIVSTVVPASASSQWCEVDPLAVIITPHGALVPVYTNNAADGLLHLTSLTLGQVSYTVSPSDNGTKTLVNMSILIPNDLFGSNYPVATTVSSGPLAIGTIYASAQGSSGTAMQVQFILDQP